MSSASFHITKECNTKLKEFLKSNEDALVFEVIGMVDTAEFIPIKKLKEKKQYSDFILNKIEEFAQTGLAQKRAGEAIWTIQKYFKHIKSTKVVNYKLVSKKDFKGFVVRAYY
jgi:hypothetical protein